MLQGELIQVLILLREAVEESTGTCCEWRLKLLPQWQ